MQPVNTEPRTALRVHFRNETKQHFMTQTFRIRVDSFPLRRFLVAALRPPDGSLYNHEGTHLMFRPDFEAL
jgi:hypothetical protein